MLNANVCEYSQVYVTVMGQWLQCEEKGSLNLAYVNHNHMVW